jgi:transcriptional regulator with XRE-family HTH domain
LFYSNYVKLCNSIGKTPSAVALEIGLQKSTVTRWNRGSEPNYATKLKVADYFGVDVEELCADTETKKESVPISENELDLRLIELLTSLTPDEMRQVDAFVQGLLAARKA